MTGLGHVFAHGMAWRLGSMAATVAAIWLLRKMHLGRLLTSWVRR